MTSIPERIGNSYAEGTSALILAPFTLISAVIINNIDAQLTAPTVIVGEALAAGALISSAIKNRRNSRRTRA